LCHCVLANVLQVLAPKQAALANLQLQGAALPLDSQLLFSSVAALLGSPGQANYSAANAALDAAAQRAQQSGVAATSVQWGAWAGAGMAVQEASTAARLERLGMGLVSIRSGLQALAAAVVSSSGGSGGGSGVLAVVPFRWQQFVAVARRPLPHLFAAYSPAEAAPSDSHGAAGAQAGPLAAVDAAVAQAAVQEAVRSILGADISASEPLMAAGLDSLGAVELQSSLERLLGLQLPSTLVFDYPTVAALTEFLAGRLSQQAVGGSAAGSSSGASQALRRLSLVPAGPAGVSGAVVMLGSSWRSPRQALAQLATPGMGVDSVARVPLDRWDVEAEPLAARFGAYLAGIAAFDAAAFSVSDAEAALMEPQQRLLLETVGEALLAVPADAALAPLRARGVYVGKFGASCHAFWR
jgi:acyl carrier protein